MAERKILYNPLPIGRLGVRKADQEVVVANDYSCLALMLEEYVSFGVTKIVFPLSSPELRTIDQMPILLNNIVDVIDDTSERESLHRVFSNLRKEFNVKIDYDSDSLKFPKLSDFAIINSITQIHEDYKKICTGFNHGIQVDINIAGFNKALNFVRSKSKNSDTRFLLAELESISNQYEEIEFFGITATKKNTPQELINILDKIINDRYYLEYGEAIQSLTLPNYRNTALTQIKSLAESLKSRNYFTEGWNYVSKLLHVWTGIPIPESKTFGALFNNKQLPSLINMDTAKKRAVEMWRSSELSNTPLNRNGHPISSEDIIWLPPMNSMQVQTSSSYESFGTVGELFQLLKKVQEQFENKM